MNLQIMNCSTTRKKVPEKVFEKHHPQIVINAVAHKQVSLMEHNCVEAIYNNAFESVLGSAYSVTPTFRRQTRTMDRSLLQIKRSIYYFITILETSRWVLQSEATANSGELFVLDKTENSMSFIEREPALSEEEISRRLALL